MISEYNREEYIELFNLLNSLGNCGVMLGFEPVAKDEPLFKLIMPSGVFGARTYVEKHIDLNAFALLTTCIKPTLIIKGVPTDYSNIEDIYKVKKSIFNKLVYNYGKLLEKELGLDDE